MANKKSDYTQLSEDVIDPTEILLGLFSIFMIGLANYFVYYYLIVPFGYIYKISETVQTVLLVVFICLSIVLFVFLTKKDYIGEIMDFHMTHFLPCTT